VLNPLGLSLIKLHIETPKLEDDRPINPIARENWDARVKNGEIKLEKKYDIDEIDVEVLADFHNPEESRIVPGMVFQCPQCEVDLRQSEDTPDRMFRIAILDHIQGHISEVKKL